MVKLSLPLTRGGKKVISEQSTPKGQVNIMEEQNTPMSKLIEVDLNKEMRKRFLE